MLRAGLLRPGSCVIANAPSIERRDAADADEPVIRALLEQAGLPTSDIPASKPRFKVIVEGGRIVAVGAIECFESTALLRSVVVAPSRRGTGLGRILVEELEKATRAAGIDRLVLLTETAREYFAGQGFQVVERSKVPSDVQRSAEFRSLCPASATCMEKVLMEAG